MYVAEKTLFLRQTDATGAIYFPEIYSLSLEVFEGFLLERGISLQEMIARGEFLLPVVHACCNFYAPIRVGDAMKIELQLGELGTTSFTLISAFKGKDGELLADTNVVHVAVDRKSGEKQPLSESMIRHLRLL